MYNVHCTCIMSTSTIVLVVSFTTTTLVNDMNSIYFTLVSSFEAFQWSIGSQDIVNVKMSMLSNLSFALC